MANLIGNGADQLPTNGMLGTAAFVDEANLVKNSGTQPPVSIAVNSTSPALTITQDGTGNALEVRDVTGDTTPFVVDASGRVAIASSPGITGAALTVGGDASSGVQDVFRSSADGGGFATRYFKNRNTNIYANTSVQSGDSLGGFLCYGADGTNYVLAARVQAEVDGAPGTNDMPGRLVFSTTADGASTPTEAMRITSAQRVSIGGPTSPLAKLHIRDGSNGVDSAQIAVEVAGGDVNDFAGFDTYAVGNALGSIRSYVESTYLSNMRFYTAGATNTLTERMRIDSSGNVSVRGGTLGYGTGSGGTVTQATSKSTAVTLNKPSGQITMHNAALAAGASVTFAVTSTAVGASDSVAVSGQWTAVDPSNYRIEVALVGAGQFNVRVTNVSAGSLSEALVINFTVIKGSAS